MRYRFFVLGTFVCILAVTSLFAQTPPPAPANLTAIFEFGPSTLGNVMLEWQMPTAGQWRYKIYCSANDTNHYQMIGTTGDRLFRDYQIMVGARYYYYVRSYAPTNAIAAASL